MKKIVYLSPLVFILLFLSSNVFAASNGNGTGNIQAAASDRAKETVNELLLFWEEKDLYVQTSSRVEKSISQVAENITVVTAKEIEDMNAHTVSEVLNRVTGVFVGFAGQDFGSSAIPTIQGSADRHVLVMLDGIPWNSLSDGHAETNTIPVKIIERIEIIKGPASSAWGSALGGVINIITKAAGSEARPSGTLSVSYGEKNSQDYGGEVHGKVGPVGYYLYAGRQRSDGLRDDRRFESNNFYSKLNIPVSKDVRLGFTFGYSGPRWNMGALPSGDITGTVVSRALFGTASLDASITRELSLKTSFYAVNQKFDIPTYVLGLGMNGTAGDLFQESIFDEKTIGGEAKLVYKRGMNTAVLGMDISHGSLDQTINVGPTIQSYGVPATTVTNPRVDKWAVFLNDTISIGDFSITPGGRYDHNSVSGSLLSPSVGVTYKAGEHTVLRGSVARGFTMPPLSFTSGGSLFLDPNPSLKPEKVWSYQAGIESSATDYLWLKAAYFYHSMKDNIERVYFASNLPPGCVGSACNDLMENKGKIIRQGVEAEAETAPVYNVSLKAGFAYVFKKPSDADSVTTYQYNLLIKYDDRKSFMAQLFGHFVWLGPSPFGAAGKYNDFVWDLNVQKKIYSTQRTDTVVFLTAHNIFNGSQFSGGDQKNPRRWFEGGVRFKF